VSDSLLIYQFNSSFVPGNKNAEWRAAVPSQFSWRNVLGWDLRKEEEEEEEEVLITGIKY
jgi:hypothetical protein